MQSLNSILDWESAVVRMDGSRELYNLVATRFCADAVQHFDKLRSAVREGDWANAGRSVHTLKGLAATVGAQQLAACAADFEADLKLLPSGAPSDLAAPRLTYRLNALQQASQRALTAVQALLPGAPNPTAQPSQSGASVPLTEQEVAQFSQSLQTLAQHLADNQMHATVVCADLWKHFGHAVGQPLADLNVAIQRLDFDAARAHCHGLRNLYR